LPPVFSHSRLSSFENCPKQFHFRYVLKIERETESIEAFLGKRVHEVLERLYLFVREGRVPSLAKVVQRFHANWQEQFAPDRVSITRSENPPQLYREIGERCLRNHYRRHYPFDADDTVGIEERVIFPLDEAGEYKMQGIVDRIARARDGVLEVHDYKTGARVPTQRRLDEDRQLALYELGVRRRFGETGPVRLVWHYLQAGHTLTSSRSPEQLAELRARTIEGIERVLREERFAPKPGPLCGWCEYQALCPAFAGERAAAEAPPALDAAEALTPAAPGMGLGPLDAATALDAAQPAAPEAEAPAGASASFRAAPPPPAPHALLPSAAAPAGPPVVQLPLFEG